MAAPCCSPRAVLAPRADHTGRPRVSAPSRYRPRRRPGDEVLLTPRSSGGAERAGTLPIDRSIALRVRAPDFRLRPTGPNSPGLAPAGFLAFSLDASKP